MKYHELRIEAHKETKRVGRGIASGKGKTAGRGTKGQGARTGSTKRPGFIGGQTPLMQQLPKLPGFLSHHVKATVIYVGQLEKFAGKTVDTQLLAKHGLIEQPFVRVKVLAGKGALTKPVTVELQGASSTAVAAIEQAGGNFTVVPRLQRTAKKPSKD